MSMKSKFIGSCGIALATFIVAANHSVFAEEVTEPPAESSSAVVEDSNLKASEDTNAQDDQGLTAETVESQNPLNEKEIVIIHTNDIHGRIKEDRGVIGMAKLAAVIEEERAKDQTTLVLDAGDAFQGLPISNETKGEDMAKLMNAVGYDAMVVGNHEFDFSLEQATKYKELLDFPILSANTYANGTRIFEASTLVDKDTSVEGDEVVVIGVTTPETYTKTHPNNIIGVEFKDPIGEVNNVIAELAAKFKAAGKNYHKYVILAHLGIDETTPAQWRGDTLADALSKNSLLLDKQVVVIDGHSHTVLQKDFGHVKYTQTGNYLNNIGKVTFKAPDKLEASLFTYNDVKDKRENAEIAAKVAEIDAKFKQANAVVFVENNEVELNGDRSNVRVRETNLGNAVTDAMYQYGQTGFSQPTDLAVTNGGGLRATIHKGQDITKGDVIAVLPFGNIISQISVTGNQLFDMFNHSLSAQLQMLEGQPVVDEKGLPLFDALGAFLHISGARVTYNPLKPVNERIILIEVLRNGEYVPIVSDETYNLATNDFLAAGGDGYTMLGGAREEGPSLDVVFAEYLKANKESLPKYQEINPRTRLIAQTLDLSDYFKVVADAHQKISNAHRTYTDESVNRVIKATHNALNWLDQAALDATIQDIQLAVNSLEEVRPRKAPLASDHLQNTPSQNQSESHSPTNLPADKDDVKSEEENNSDKDDVKSEEGNSSDKERENDSIPNKEGHPVEKPSSTHIKAASLPATGEHPSTLFTGAALAILIGLGLLYPSKREQA